jgi:DNA modification methylase
MGTGTTLIACEKSGIKSFGIELSEQYCDIIIKRWQDFTGQKAIREDGVLWDDMEVING